MEFKENKQNSYSNNMDIFIIKIKNNENICNILDFVDNNNSDFLDYSTIPFLYNKEEIKEKQKNEENIFNNKNENL